MSQPSGNVHCFLTTPWWAMGSRVTDGCGSGLFVNGMAARARAGLLNVLLGATIVLLLARPDLDPVIYVAPLVIFDMVMAAIFGLTPLSPIGVLGTALTMKIPPVWKPHKPKRFSWILGAVLGVCCLTFRLWHFPVAWILSVLGVCFSLTWIESVLGVCVGCWLYGLFFKCETCHVPVSPH